MNMGKEYGLQKTRLSLILYPVLAAFILSCAIAMTSKNQAIAKDTELPSITKVEVASDAQTTVIKIICNKPAPTYTAFQLADPPRIVLDIRGKQDPELAPLMKIKSGQINQISFQEVTAQTGTIRMMIELDSPLDYQAETIDNIIQLTLKAKSASSSTAPVTTESTVASSAESTPAKPRIFFQPKSSDLNQVLGIDFTMLEQGKSRLVVTTDKKSAYDLKQQGPKALVLKLGKTTLPDLLKRELDSRHFEGVVDQVKASFVPNDKQVSIAIALREMVPFHIDQNDNEIYIDFARTSIKPPGQKIVPLQMAEARNQTVTPLTPQIKNDVTPEVSNKDEPPYLSLPTVMKPKAEAPMGDTEILTEQPQNTSGLKKRYRGEPMTMDFVNADVTNLLKLISEVSNLNIVWGPEVQGTVSMRLKNVPWDQALDMILANNGLAKREQGNVIWITTASKMAQWEADERKKKEELDAEIKRKFDSQKKQEELEPLISDYLPLDFASTKDIKPLLDNIKTARGKISEDERTNTIIMTDVAASLQKARQIIKQFDIPVKQIMIEARVVDATDDFNRSLGVQWTDHTKAYRFNKWGAGSSYTVPPSTYKGDVADPLNVPGQFAYGGSFATNAPAGWASNIGLTVAKLTSSGLGSMTLDARLALSESEGKSKTISAPKVIAREGTEAVIRRGDVIIARKETADKIEFKEIEALLSLYVTPVKVSFNDFITLKVKVTDDRPVFYQTNDVGITKKSVETNLMVKTGDTVVIGGIYKEDRNESETGIPALKRIPFIGWLFKAKYNKINKSELLIFITPTVLPLER
jgi:type IV pilus assembly protein PilQ